MILNGSIPVSLLVPGQNSRPLPVKMYVVIALLPKAISYADCSLTDYCGSFKCGFSGCRRDYCNEHDLLPLPWPDWTREVRVFSSSFDVPSLMLSLIVQDRQYCSMAYDLCHQLWSYHDVGIQARLSLGDT